MKLAIISNIEKLNDQFVTGSKTIRSIVTIQHHSKYVEDNINGQVTRIELKSDLEMTTIINNVLLDYIESHIGKRIRADDLMTDDHCVNIEMIDHQLLIKKINQKYVLFKLEKTTTGWFTVSTSTHAIPIGKYQILPIETECSIESERITQLKNIISTLSGEKNDLLAECGSLESKIKHLNAENNFLKDVLNKI